MAGSEGILGEIRLKYISYRKEREPDCPPNAWRSAGLCLLGVAVLEDIQLYFSADNRGTHATGTFISIPCP